MGIPYAKDGTKGAAASYFLAKGKKKKLNTAVADDKLPYFGKK